MSRLLHAVKRVNVGTETACDRASVVRRQCDRDDDFLIVRWVAGAYPDTEGAMPKVPIVPPVASAEVERLMALGMTSAGLSSTGKGATSVHYRTPVEIAATVFEVQAKDPHHFPTTSDVYRFNDRVGLEVLQRGMALPTTLAALDAVHAVRDNNITRTRGDEVISETETAVQDLLTRGPRGEAEAQALVQRVRNELDGLPSTFWRAEFLSQLERKVLPLFRTGMNGRVIRVPLFKNLYQDDEEAARFA